MISNKKIGLIISNRNFGGQESRYLKISYLLFKRSIRVSVFINEHLYSKIKVRHPNLWEDKQFMENVRSVKITRSPKVQTILNLLFFHILKIDPFLLSAKKEIKQINPDIIISNKDLINLKTLRSFYSGVIIKDYTSPENVDRSFIKKDYNNFHVANSYFFVSPSVRKRFDSWLKEKEHLFVEDFRLHTFQTPFNNNNYRTINYKNKKKSIVFAHRFIQRKNPLIFAQVIKNICSDERYKEWSFGFYGRGPLESKIKELLNDEIREGRIDFGFTEELEQKLISSKVFVSLIEPDNFPSQSIIEAMGCGNALFLLNSGESQKFIQNNGVLVKNTFEDILEKLKYLMKLDLTELNKNSANLSKDKFSHEKYLNEWLENLSLSK